MTLAHVTGRSVASGVTPKRILLGRIADAHGIRGEVIIHAFTDPPENIAAYGPLMDEAGARAFEIQSARATAKGVVARLKGVADRTAAEALKGVDLYVDRDRLPPAADGEFYHVDLIGTGGRRSAGPAHRHRSSPCRTLAPAICWRSALPARNRPSSSRSTKRTCPP